MSFVARQALRRAALRPHARFLSAPAALSERTPIVATLSEEELSKSAYWAELNAVHHHGAETGDMWRKISYYICLPAILVCSAYVYNLEMAHEAHLEHLRHENDGKLPEKPAYEYMNRRIKPFPWGPNSLFFNPAVQKDMSEE